MYFLLPHWVPATWRSPAQTGGAPNAVEELKQYKSLLDAGVITEEEFAAKKRQLLGILIGHNARVTHAPTPVSS
mgnify:CR=1 FL=1